ncbi:MAG: hypothetical protein WDZ52_15770 [Pseudohongiellaceae bacterium]
MKVAEVITLGSLSTADIAGLAGDESYDARASRSLTSTRGLKLSVAISACLHLVLAGTVYYLVIDVAAVETTRPQSIQVKFVLFNPLSAQNEEAIPEADSENTLATETDAVTLAAEGSVIAQERQEKIPATESSATPGPDVAQTLVLDTTNRVIETITMPSAEAVRSSIMNLRRNQTSLFTSRDCNEIEEDSEFNNCRPRDDRDYSALSRNPVYDSYNSARVISRSRETVTTFARQSTQVAAALASNNLPAGLSGYVLEELEQGIETYSNSSSRAVNRMNTMIDKSAAGEMSRRLFSPWVQQQSAVLLKRKVEN